MPGRNSAGKMAASKAIKGGGRGGKAGLGWTKTKCVKVLILKSNSLTDVSGVEHGN